MLSDIEIAQQAKMLPITEVAAKLGIGEEDIITLVLPYVNTAREGVKRLAELLETYGTYESNGIIISDVEVERI